VSISAVIPHRNSGELLARCVEALEAARGVDEVVVADEGSTDGSAEGVSGRPLVRVVASPGRGFAVAANAGISAARGERLLLMNSDAFVRPDTVERLARRLDADPRLALCGAALVDETGARAKSHSSLFTLRHALLGAVGVTARLRQEGSGLERVEAVFPTCALARREAVEDVGGFDERFVFYYEDQDLCRRLALAGWSQAVDWEAEAVHVGGGSTSVLAPQRWFRQYHASRLVYLRKHYPQGWRLYAALWALKASVHALAWSARAVASRLRSDAEGAELARQWAAAFGRTVFSAR
jgi:GT2 family glycosyltransferase